jgi:hypothetical protein
MPFPLSREGTDGVTIDRQLDRIVIVSINKTISVITSNNANLSSIGGLLGTSCTVTQGLWENDHRKTISHFPFCYGLGLFHD